jgi:hypothetical protein
MLVVMNEQPHNSEALIREINRYLATVDLYRAERCEPKWLPELAQAELRFIFRSLKREARTNAT